MNDIRFGDGESPHYSVSSAQDQPRRRTPWNTLGGRVISLVSRKGGVGKTTSAVNLGAAFALSDHSVLVVGVDPQCGICRTLGVKPHELPVCLTEIFDGGTRLTDLVQQSPLAGLGFVSPRILALDQEERYLETMESQAVDFVREIDRARSLYDTILIDCPPSLGPATQASLLASDSYLVPVQAEELCRESLDSLLEFVDTFRERNFPSEGEDDEFAATPLALEGLFLTMDSPNTRMGRHVSARVHEDFGGVLFGTPIPRTVRLSEMALRGKPAVIYDRRSAGSRAYFDLADEIVARYAVEAHGISEPAVTAAAENGEADRLETAGKYTAGGLERIVSDLGEQTAQRGQRAEEAFGGPDMVSLDDLLDEEERRGGSDEWDDDNWSGNRSRDRLN